MPQVPDLVPSVVPSGALPEVNLPVPSDAFGGAVGQALQHMGVSVEQDGDKIWDRAVQMQDLQNRTEVDNADAEFIKQTALKHAEFNAQVGENAGPVALRQHIQDIENIRQNIRQGLSNPMSQRMFNSTSLSTMGRYISNASNHSATEVKSAYRQGLALKVSTLANEAADDPNNPILRGQLRASATVEAKEKGLDPQDWPEYVNNVEAPVNLESIKRVADKNPTLVKEMIEDYHNKGALPGKLYTDALEIYKRSAYQIAPDQIATQVTADLKNQTDPTETGATEQERIQQARDIAQQKYPDLPLMATEAEHAVSRAYNSHLGAIRDLNHRDMNLAGDILEGNYAPNGKAPTTMDEIKAAPGGADMLRRVGHNFSQMQKIKRGLLTNSKGVFQPTQENTDLYHEILGQLTSNDPKDNAVAQDIFIPGLEMPQSYRDVLRRAQDELFKGNRSPRINQAMDVLKPSLEGMSKEDVNKFRGTIRPIIQDYMSNNNNKMMPDDEIRKMGARLLQTLPGTGYFGSNIGATRTFEQEPPDEVVEQVKKGATKQGEAPPTDAQIQAEYVRQLYEKLQEEGLKRLNQK